MDCKKLISGLIKLKWEQQSEIDLLEKEIKKLTNKKENQNHTSAHNTISLSAKPRNKVTKPKNFFPKLTKREKEILKRIVEEHTSQEIAHKLFISLGTAETHRRNLISKLRVKNTAGLVRMALEYKLI